MLDTSTLIVECEVKKSDPDQGVYLMLFAAAVQVKLHLDTDISEALNVEGFSLVYASESVQVDQYLRDNPQRTQEVEALLKYLSTERRIAFMKLYSLDETAKAQEAFLVLNEQIAPLTDSEALNEYLQKPWIGEALKKTLFAQPAPQNDPDESALLHTYLIVDATLRTQITGYFDLDLISHAKVECLFKGRAAETLKTAAPYLIDMTLTADEYTDDSKITNFHKDFIENHWAHNTGIVIRSYASMDVVLHHYRRFTKVQDETGEWIFFRFWDPNILIPYLTGIKHWQERALLWFNLGDSLLIDSVIAHGIDKDTLISIGPSQSIRYITQRQPVAYTEDDFEILEVEFLKYRGKKIIAELLIEHPDLKEINQVPVKEFLQEQIDWLHGNGFFEQPEIELILIISLKYQCAIDEFPQPLKSLLTDLALTIPARVRLITKHAAYQFETVQ